MELAEVMRRVERKAETWKFIHASPGGHDNRSHPDCPWCQLRASRAT